MMEDKVVYQHRAVIGSGQWDEKVQWCRENLYHGGHYEPNWRILYPYIEFDNEKEYVWFMLRWS